MFNNIQKSLIISIFILLAGTASAGIELDAGLSNSGPQMGDEINIYAYLKNTGTSPINVNLNMRIGESDICSKTVSALLPGTEKRVNCTLKITKDMPCGEQIIQVNANGGGDSQSETLYLRISGKSYRMILEPDNPELDRELKITVKDEDEKAVNNAKISLVKIEGDATTGESEYPVDIGEVYTNSNGIAILTINKAGRYKIGAEYERDGYCKSVFWKREVLNSFIVQGLKSTYGLDDDFDINVTDRNGNPFDVYIDFFNGPVDRYYDTSDVPFNFKQKGFEKGTYNVEFREKKESWQPATYHAIIEKITITAGRTASSTSTSSTTSSTTKTEDTRPLLKIEITPDPGKIKVGDKITIYVTADGKAVDGAKVTVSSMFGESKELETPSSGKVEYKIERADLYPIHAEKEGYKPTDLSLEVGTEEIYNEPVQEEASSEEESQTVNKEPEDTNPSEVTGENASETNELAASNEQSLTNTTLITQAQISEAGKPSYFEKINYKTIFIILGIIAALLIILILLLVIWKLIKQ